MSRDKRPNELRENVKSLPGKKNTREWCRGKVGRHHAVEVRVNPQIVEMNVRASKGVPACHWFPFGDENARPERGIWICHHQIHCVNCGKILSHALGDDCPDRTVEPAATTGTQ